jgi:hypothetical protein
VSLRQIRSEKVWPILVSILASEHRNENLRETAIKTLGEVGTEETLTILRRIAHTGDSARFGQLAARRAVTRLESRLKSKPAATIPGNDVSDYRDVFLCHASEDKVEIVDPLSIALGADGISYWLDRAEILWGDSVTDKVNDGLRVSRYVVAILTTAFLQKNWPKRELNAILNLEATTGVVRILVLLAGGSQQKELILRQFPLLNDKLYLNWEGSPEPVVAALRKRLSSSATHSPLIVAQRVSVQPQSRATGILNLAGNIEARKETFVKRLKCQDARKYLQGIADTITKMASSIAAGNIPHTEMGAIRTHARLLSDALRTSLTLMEAGELVTELERISDPKTIMGQDFPDREAFVVDLQRVAGVFEALGSACAVNYDLT